MPQVFSPRYTEFELPIYQVLNDFAHLADPHHAVKQPFKGLRSFSPKFDVKETKAAYELHGELPGIDQKDVSIEWIDGNTLSISGKVERRQERKDSAASTPTEEDKADSDYVKPSVEEATDESEKQSVQTTETVTEDAKKETSKPADDGVRYWVTERSYGSFKRTFKFPARVDQEAVKASLKNGVLAITVPKSALPAQRRINIE